MRILVAASIERMSIRSTSSPRRQKPATAVEEDETAIGGRDAACGVHAISMWENPAESETHIAWAREFMQAMEPFTIPGISLNFTSDQTEDKVKASFGSEKKYERLVALKNKYDPTNLFRLNQNIKPTAQSGAVS